MMSRFLSKMDFEEEIRDHNWTPGWMIIIGCVYLAVSCLILLAAALDWGDKNGDGAKIILGAVAYLFADAALYQIVGALEYEKSQKGN